MALQDNVKSAMRTPIRSRWPLFELFMLVTVGVIGWAAWGSWELMTELDDSRRGGDRRRQQTQQLNRRGNENARLLELHAIRDDFMGFEKHVQPALQEMRAALRRYVQTSAAQEWKTFEWSRKALASWMDRMGERTRSRDLASLNAWVDRRAVLSSNGVDRPSVDVGKLLGQLRDASAEYVASANFIDQTINTSSPRSVPTLTPPRRVNVTPARDADAERRREVIEERLNIAEEQSLKLLEIVDRAHRDATTMQWFIELQALIPPKPEIDAGEPLQDLQTRFLPFIYTLSAGLVGLCIFSGVAMYRRFVVAPLHLKLVERETLLEQQQKFAHFEKLTAVLAHEIKQPLSAINVWVWTLQKNLIEGTAEHKGAAVIRSELNRVDQIVKDFLKLTQPVEPRFVSMKSGGLLNEIADLLRPKLERSAIKLKLDATTDASFQGDPQQLKQVLMNLVQNAAESIGEEGQITLRSRRNRMALNGDKTDAVVIEVQDTGPGIPAEVQERLFDPFFSTKENGTGLGLAIAARIVDKHEGALVFETQQGHGTTFGIVLPIERK
jgi:signal transduction histidine kinase